MKMLVWYLWWLNVKGFNSTALSWRWLGALPAQGRCHAASSPAQALCIGAELARGSWSNHLPPSPQGQGQGSGASRGAAGQLAAGLRNLVAAQILQMTSGLAGTVSRIWGLATGAGRSLPAVPQLHGQPEGIAGRGRMLAGRRASRSLEQLISWLLTEKRMWIGSYARSKGKPGQKSVVLEYLSGW